jgi:hypothetical protein
MLSSEEFLQVIASGLEDIFADLYPERMGFALIVFPFSGGVSDYISNGERKDMIKALRETADRIETNQIIPPTQGNA